MDRDGASDHRGPPVFILVFLLDIVVLFVIYNHKMFTAYTLENSNGGCVDLTF